MNNTDKLLRALIDALGYEIEEVHNSQPDPEMILSGWVAEPDSYKLTERAGKTRDVNWADFTVSTYIGTGEEGSGDEYKPMRRKIKTERGEFIDKACDVICNPDSFAPALDMDQAAALYDAGARFK